MASIDDIFKNASGKRKLDAIKDPNEIYKSSKLSTGAPASSSRQPRVSGDSPSHPGSDGDADADVEAGPTRPPPDDEGGGGALDEGDDDEGRFFGGGITAKQSEVLDYVDGAGEADAAPAKIDAGWVRKTAQNLEKHMTRNSELRAKYESEPQKFIGSEADLDGAIKGLSILSEHTDLYPEFVNVGAAANLVGLLSHENTDIAIDAIEIINELTDEDVAADDSDWNALTDALIDVDLIGLLASNFSRLNEDDEADRNGVYYAMCIVENLCSRPATAARVGQDDALLQWLLQRIQRKEPSVSQNKQYAAEVLAILCQTTPETRRRIVSHDAVDIMLQLVAPYRKGDPDRSGEEEEYMENLFEALTCLTDEAEGKAKFIEAEGTELCLIMFKDGKKSKAPALRLMDHATTGRSAGGDNVCLRLVTAGGLKPLFTLFTKTQDQRLLEHLVGIMASMLRLLPGDSPERIRTLAKFVEKDYAKTAKLLRLRRDHAARVRRAEAAFRAENRPLNNDNNNDDDDNDDDVRAVELLSRRLDAGLFTLQQLDVLLAWLVAEDGGARARIINLLGEQGEDLGAVAATLEEQRQGLDMTDEDNREMGDMLRTLVEFLRAVMSNTKSS